MENTDKKFRINAKNIFLTYSQASELPTRELVYESLELICKGKNLSGLAVAQEKHQDGSFHYHCFLDFSKPFNTFNPRIFDIYEVHPKIESVRNREKALGYILKEDRRVLMSQHIMNLLTRWDSTARYLIENYLKKGYGPDYTAVMMKDYGFNNVHKIKTWWKALQGGEIRKRELNKNGWEPVLEKLKELDERIYRHLVVAAGYREDQARPLKTKNLLLWSSKPSMGKTSFTLFLKEHLKSFDFPMDGWWDGYEDKFYQVIIWNETSFVGWSIQELNKFFDGSGMMLPIKGAKQTKSDNPLIIGTSNCDLRGLLKQKGFDDEKIEFYLPILRARIVEVEVDENMLWKVLGDMEYANKPVKLDEDER